MKTVHRCHEVDLFRFGAALAVVFYHYTFRGYAADARSLLPFPELAGVTKYGYLGVDLFFIISGFVIMLSAAGKNVRGFVISRAVRLYPAFWAGASLTALAGYWLGQGQFSVSPARYLANLTMLGGYFGVEPVDGVYWTLLVEIKFYFLVGMLIFLGQLGRMRYFMMAWLLASTLPWWHALPLHVADFLIPEWSSYFIAGALFFCIRNGDRRWLDYGLLMVASLLSIACAWQRLPAFERHFHVALSAPVVAATIVAFYLLMLAMALGKLQLLNRRAMLLPGALSYPLYLIHQNLGFMLLNAGLGWLDKYWLLAGVLALMLLASYLIHRYVEQGLGRSLARGLRQLAGSTTVSPVSHS